MRQNVREEGKKKRREKKVRWERMHVSVKDGKGEEKIICNGSVEKVQREWEWNWREKLKL